MRCRLNFCWVVISLAALLSISFSIMVHRYGKVEGPNASSVISEDSIIKICKLLRYQMSSGAITKSLMEDWKTIQCIRYMEGASRNRTAGLESVPRRQVDGQRLHQTIPALRGSAVPGRSSEKLISETKGESIIPKSGTRPENTPYVSPFSPDVERKRMAQLYTALEKELQRYAKENYLEVFLKSLYSKGLDSIQKSFSKE